MVEGCEAEDYGGGTGPCATVSGTRGLEDNRRPIILTPVALRAFRDCWQAEKLPAILVGPGE